MKFLYDNTTDNIANPNHPPKQVTYGPDSKDEMAELWFQVFTQSDADRTKLAQAYSLKTRRVFVDYANFLFSRDPNHPEGHMIMGQEYVAAGKYKEAFLHYRNVVNVDSENVDAYYNLGIILLNSRQFEQAGAVFKKVMELDPEEAQAYGQLGSTYLGLNRLQEAKAFLRKSVELNPTDPIGRGLLARFLEAKERFKTTSRLLRFSTYFTRTKKAAVYLTIP